MFSPAFWSRSLGVALLTTVLLSQGWLGQGTPQTGQTSQATLGIATVAWADPDPANPTATAPAAPTAPPDNPFFGRGGEDVLKNAVGVTDNTLAAGSTDPIGFLKLVIATIANLLLTLLASLSVLALIYAGFLWVTAHGEADPVTKAKTIVGYAVAGLLLAFFSYAIITAVTGLRNQAPVQQAPAGTGGQPGADAGGATGPLPPAPDAGAAGPLPPPAPDRTGGATGPFPPDPGGVTGPKPPGNP